MPDQNIDLSSLVKKYFTTEYITIITFIFYGWGLLYNYNYYYIFGINIFKYLSLQEVLLDTLIYFIGIIFLTVITQLLAITVLYFSILLLSFRYRKHWYVGLRIREKGYTKRFLSYSFYGDIFIMFLIQYSDSFLGFDSYFYGKFIFPIIMFSIIAKLVVLYSITKNSRDLIVAVTFTIMLLLTVIFMNSMEGSTKILNSKSNIKTSFEFTNHITYTTNDSICFIGETNSTIFLYDKYLKKTIILNRVNLNATTINMNNSHNEKGATETATPKKK